MRARALVVRSASHGEDRTRRKVNSPSPASSRLSCATGPRAARRHPSTAARPGAAAPEPVDAPAVAAGEVDPEDRFIDTGRAAVIPAARLAPPFGARPIGLLDPGPGHRERGWPEARRQGARPCAMAIAVPAVVHPRRFRRPQGGLELLLHQRFDGGAGARMRARIAFSMLSAPNRLPLSSPDFLADCSIASSSGTRLPAGAALGLNCTG